MKTLTEKNYWEKTYTHRHGQQSLNIDGFKNFPNHLILNKLLQTDLKNKLVLEIGAGDSVWLPYLANQFDSSKFVGLDYTENGCTLLTQRAHEAGVNIEVVQEDMFAQTSRLHNKFNYVMSFGVVEHFDDLGFALASKKKYLTQDGIMFTLIPNMAGVLGSLVRNWNREIYDKHNPHDLASFLNGHQQAGLEVIAGGYLGSNNFGVLSSCFPERKGLPWQLSRVLVAASLASWWIEDKTGDFPTTKTFSPYIYAISRGI
jgi:2-polyprenyl-3-methyl-5-hydroxy-6-metoxy-1,4-benzoquinol methylase